MDQGTTGGQAAAQGAARQDEIGVADEDGLSLKEVATFLAVAAGAFMAVLDFFIVLVALPSIATELKATQAQLQLIVAGYAIANAAVLIAAGKLGDTVGRKRMFLGGMVLFCVASAACAMAQSGEQLVVFRLLQGASAAVLQPQVMALLNSSFEGRKRLKLFGYYAVAMGMGGVAGQAIGGALIEMAPLGMTWQWCFLINLPIGALAMALGSGAIAETKLGSAERQDWVGLALAMISIGLMVTALTYAREAMSWVIAAAMIVASIAVGGMFAAWELNRRDNGKAHLIKKELMQAAGFTKGARTVLLFHCGLASFYFVIGVHLQTYSQLSPMASGLAFGVLGAAFMAASVKAAWLRGRLGKWLVPTGALVMCAGHLLQLVSFAEGLSVKVSVMALLVEGAGIGMVMAPLVSMSLAAVPKQVAGLASGIVMTMQSAGNALGVAVIGGMFLWMEPSQGFGAAMIALSLVSLAVGMMAWRIGRQPGNQG